MSVRARRNGFSSQGAHGRPSLRATTTFPRAGIDWSPLAPSGHIQLHLWTGAVTYYAVEADGRMHRNAAWTYESPWRAAQRIAGHMTFRRVVRIGVATQSVGPIGTRGPLLPLLGRD